VTSSAAWSVQSGHTSMVFNDLMWVMGVFDARINYKPPGVWSSFLPTPVPTVVPTTVQTVLLTITSTVFATQFPTAVQIVSPTLTPTETIKGSVLSAMVVLAANVMTMLHVPQRPRTSTWSKLLP
jgi:hypothetical protein